MTKMRFGFETMDQLKKANKVRLPGKGEFFRRGYVIHTDLLLGGYFITSLVFGNPDGPIKKYSNFVVRRIDSPDGRIAIVSSGHQSLELAKEAMPVKGE